MGFDDDFDDFCLPDDVLAAVMACQQPTSARNAQAPDMFASFLPAGPLPPPLQPGHFTTDIARASQPHCCNAEGQPIPSHSHLMVQHWTGPALGAASIPAAVTGGIGSIIADAAPSYHCAGTLLTHSHIPAAASLQPQNATHIEELLQERTTLVSACQRAEGEVAILRARMEEDEQRSKKVIWCSTTECSAPQRSAVTHNRAQC